MIYVAIFAIGALVGIITFIMLVGKYSSFLDDITSGGD